MFFEVYELRNVLAHEIWGSSPDCPDAILFATLDEESRLSIASGRLWHYAQTNPREAFDATIRFIRSIKIVTPDQIALALNDAKACSWILMTLSLFLDAPDEEKRKNMQQAFAAFWATAHLFDHEVGLPTRVEVSATRSKTVTGY